MYRKILVAVDGSETSKLALAEALRVARFAQGEVRVACVVDTIAPLGMGVTYVPAELLEAYREAGAQRLAEARAEAGAAGVPCSTELLELQGVTDDIADCLQRCAARYGAELAVLGTHGRRGVRRAMLGSVAERFVRHASCPALLVREQTAQVALPGTSGPEQTRD